MSCHSGRIEESECITITFQIPRNTQDDNMIGKTIMTHPLLSSVIFA